ncbi:MAG: ClbS/DfsB family four-helix bundle protein [Gemmatimonadota bacterium]
MRYDSKEQLLASIEGEHDTLVEMLDGIPASRWGESGVWGDGWTVTDLVAHLSEWHRMFLRWYRDGLEGRSPDMPAPGYKWNQTPELNREIQRKHRDESPDRARADFEASHADVLEVARDLPAEALLRPGHFEWTGKHPLTTYLGPNTASHYRFAIKVLKRWRGKGG